MSSPVKRTLVQNVGLVLSFIVLFGIYLIPTPPDLSTAAHRMIGILFFAIVMWVTSAVSYPVSAVFLITAMTTALGTAPDSANTAKILGTSNALKMAIAGYSSTAWALVTAAMFISVAMTKTGLDKRIAVTVLSKIGTKPSHIYIGVIITGLILAFFIPSATARLACVVPIILGITESLKIPRTHAFTALLVVGATQADTLWNIMIQTAAAQNLVATGFISSQLGVNVSWSSWLVATIPYSLIMIVIYYFLSKCILKPDTSDLSLGEFKASTLKEGLPPFSMDEKKLLTLSIILLGFWATGGHLHKFDTATTTIVAVALFFLPGIGFLDWKYAQSRVDWGSVVMFGAGISLGGALLKTKAAAYLATSLIHAFSLETATLFVVMAIVTAFLIAIHLGFASATALSSAMIPIVISIVAALETPVENPVGLIMIAQFSICFGFILPVNSPQGMVAYSSNTFDVKTFMKTGIPITLIGYVLLLIFGATYWHWIGII